MSGAVFLAPLSSVSGLVWVVIQWSLRLAALGVAGASAVASPSGELPALSRVPLPDGLRVERLVDDARLDGHAVAIRRLHSPASCQDLQAAIASVWRGRLSAHVLVRQADESPIVSAALPAGFISVQLQPLVDGGCQGLLSRWPLERPPAAATQARIESLFPGWPAQVRVLRQFDDRGAAGPSAGNTQRAGTVIGVSSLSVARLLDLFRERLLAQGYRLQPSVSTPGGASPSTLMADKPGAALALFLNDRGESTEVVLILDRRSP
ncbi:MAG: hypothetical protein NTV19_05500 [Burkholderiales bacterium]|nr:hypothetical protein [Burkholderiales bacterium]